jgi:hypothetical protein
MGQGVLGRLKTNSRCPGRARAVPGGAEFVRPDCFDVRRAGRPLPGPAAGPIVFTRLSASHTVPRCCFPPLRRGLPPARGLPRGRARPWRRPSQRGRTRQRLSPGPRPRPWISGERAPPAPLRCPIAPPKRASRGTGGSIAPGAAGDRAAAGPPRGGAARRRAPARATGGGGGTLLQRGPADERLLTPYHAPGPTPTQAVAAAAAGGAGARGARVRGWGWGTSGRDPAARVFDRRRGTLG